MYKSKPPPCIDYILLKIYPHLECVSGERMLNMFEVEDCEESGIDYKEGKV